LRLKRRRPRLEWWCDKEGREWKKEHYRRYITACLDKMEGREVVWRYCTIVTTRKTPGTGAFIAKTGLLSEKARSGLVGE
jgi:hypothetical protein